MNFIQEFLKTGVLWVMEGDHMIGELRAGMYSIYYTPRNQNYPPSNLGGNPFAPGREYPMVEFINILNSRRQHPGTRVHPFLIDGTGGYIGIENEVWMSRSRSPKDNFCLKFPCDNLNYSSLLNVW